MNKEELHELMRERIMRIRSDRNISLYELSLEIGISYNALYNLMNPRHSISEKVEAKVSSFIATYMTKDEKIEAYRLDNEEIKANLGKLEKENRQLKDKNIQLEQKIGAIKVILNKFADRFNDILDLTNFLEVRSEDENGYMYGEEEAIWGDGLTELSELIGDFTEFVEEVK